MHFVRSTMQWGHKLEIYRCILTNCMKLNGVMVRMQNGSLIHGQPPIVMALWPQWQAGLPLVVFRPQVVVVAEVITVVVLVRLVWALVLGVGRGPLLSRLSLLLQRAHRVNHPLDHQTVEGDHLLHLRLAHRLLRLARVFRVLLIQMRL